MFRRIKKKKDNRPEKKFWENPPDKVYNDYYHPTIISKMFLAPDHIAVVSHPAPQTIYFQLVSKKFLQSLTTLSYFHWRWGNQEKKK